MCAWVTPAAAAPEVLRLSHGSHGDSVRVVLHLSKPPAFASFTLNAPDRLVLDFPGLTWAVPEDQLTDIPHVGKVRHGLFRPDRARIVFELTRPLALDRIFTQPGAGSEPARLVMDLSPVERAAFDASAGAPEQARWRGTAPPPPEPGAGEIVIAIDPGHGGVDPGATHGGVSEKTVVLEFARQLAAELERRAGYRAYLTRDRDTFVPLAVRVARAHRAGAHVLISVHADTVEAGRARGMSIYRLSEQATDASAAALAERENRSDVLAGAALDGEGDDLTRLLIELAQRGTKVESAKLAVSVLETLKGQMRLLRTRPLREANFRVLKAPDIPSILLELGFLNDAKDRQRLTDPEWRARAVVLVADGIARWRGEASPGFLAPR